VRWCGWHLNERAKQHYLALLLNIASGKLATTAVVSRDNLTASQALQYVAALIVDGNELNDLLAVVISETINEGRRVCAGVIDPTYGTIAYKSGPNGGSREIAFSVAPNPGLGPRTFLFSTAAAGPVKLVLLDVSGRQIACLYDGVMEAGVHGIGWNGDALRETTGNGVFFARLKTTAGTQVLKVMQVAK